MQKKMIRSCAQIFTCVLTLFCSSCGVAASQDWNRQASSISVQELQADIEELKYQANHVKVDMGILEEKVNNQDRSTVSLQKKILDGGQLHQQVMKGTLQDLEKKLGNLEKVQEGFLADLRSLKEHFHDVNNTLAQYKTKINELVVSFSDQSEWTEKNVKALKGAMESMVTLVQRDSSNTGVAYYTVRSGDSLDKISRMYKTNVESIKQMNDLTSDLIVVGQELKVPNSR